MPRAPQCDLCPWHRRCVARRQNRITDLPNLGERSASTARRFVAVVVEKNGKVLVRQRPARVVNAHLWEFPNVEVPLHASPADVRRTIEAELGCGVEALNPVGTIRHTITRYRIAMDVFEVTLNGALPAERCGIWKSRRSLASFAFSSAHARVVQQQLQS